MEDAVPNARSKVRENLRAIGAIALLCYGPYLSVMTVHAVLYLSGLIPPLYGIVESYWWCFFSSIAISVLYKHGFKFRHHAVVLGLAVLGTLACLGLAFAINFKAVKVEGNSMQPTFLPGDVLLVDLTVAPDERYGVYTLNLEDEDHAHLIKRLVGLPGESMDVRYGRVFADKQEVYPNDGTPSDTWNENSPANARFYSGPRENGDKYFVLGDNPPDSRDSRHFGAINQAAFEGRVVWSLRGSRGLAPVE